MSSLRNLFRRDAGGGGSIYEHIRSHVRPDGPGLTEGGMKLPDESDREDAWFWGAGVKDGIASHHMGAGPSDDRVDEIFDLINRAGWRGGGEIQELEDVLATIEASSIVDPLLDRLRASQISAQELETLGRNLAKTSSYRSAVKIGIAMLGTVATRRNRDLITMLGRHDEFTLYSAVALSNTEADPEGALWELAKLVGGWGRIHLVERLRTTTRPEIQEWILRGGFRNSVMDEYLAYIAATTGGLTRALDVDDPDDELLNAACDIVRALIQGGPAEDIDDYPDASIAIERLVGHLENRASTIHHLLAVNHIRRYLENDKRWEPGNGHDWPDGLRDRLKASCRGIIDRPMWRSLALDGMDSEDRVLFWEAERAARLLEIDTLEIHLQRLAAHPLDGDWYTVMEFVDAARVGRVLELAERVLPLAEIASGPGTALGLGPDYGAHRALGFVVQGLGRFPGKGWSLVSTALRSPVVNNRNMALKTLEAWDAPTWPADAEATVRAAASIEPDEKVRARMEAFAGEAPPQP